MTLPGMDTVDAVLEWAREYGRHRDGSGSLYLADEHIAIATHLADCVRWRRAMDADRDFTPVALSECVAHALAVELNVQRARLYDGWAAMARALEDRVRRAEAEVVFRSTRSARDARLRAAVEARCARAETGHHPDHTTLADLEGHMLRALLDAADRPDDGPQGDRG